LATTVVFVPSHRDVHHDFVYPQPPFSTNVNTAEFNAAEVKLCLAYSLEYQNAINVVFPRELCSNISDNKRRKTHNNKWHNGGSLLRSQYQ